MARPLRIELAGGLYHVTSRGDRREDIFFNNSDRHAWLRILGEVCDRFNWTCHAWCQMSNHYHVVVETIEGNLSAGMRQINGVYTQAINRGHNRIGHVFQGRYKAIIVEKDDYLLELARYGMRSPWEKLRGQVFLGGDEFIKRMQKLADKSTVGEIPRAQRRPLAKPLNHYRDKLSDVRKGMAAAYATGDYTMQEIAKCFDVHYATVSRAVRQRGMKV